MIKLEQADIKAIQDVAALADSESGLPAPGECWIDGAWRPIETPPGSPGWTMRVQDIEHDADKGVYSYEIDDDLAAKIEAAAIVQEKDRTELESALASCAFIVAEAKAIAEAKPSNEENQIEETLP